MVSYLYAKRVFNNANGGAPLLVTTPLVIESPKTVILVFLFISISLLPYKKYAKRVWAAVA